MSIISGIYEIRCTITNKCYIGSSVDIPRRFKQHIYSLNSNTHDNRYLQSAWNKYGFAQFVFTVLFYYEPNELIFIEQRCINILKPDFNICVKVVNSHLGVKRSELTRQRLRDAKLGKCLSDSHRENIRKATLGNTSALGYKYTPEQKKALSIALMGNTNAKGRIVSDETKKKISVSNTGRVCSSEQKLKMKKLLTGRKRSSDAIERTRIGNLGKKRSDESKAKMGRKVIDTQTFIEYATIQMAADALGIKKGTLYAMLVGKNKNKTSLVFV